MIAVENGVCYIWEQRTSFGGSCPSPPT